MPHRDASNTDNLEAALSRHAELAARPSREQLQAIVAGEGGDSGDDGQRKIPPSRTASQREALYNSIIALLDRELSRTPKCPPKD